MPVPCEMEQCGRATLGAAPASDDENVAGAQERGREVLARRLHGRRHDEPLGRGIEDLRAS